MPRELVIDAESGLPEIKATRDDEGRLTFRVHYVNSPGGMSLYLPVDDEVQRLVRHRVAPDDSEAKRLRQLQLGVAASLSTADAKRVQRLADLEAQLEATTIELGETSQALREAENKLAKLVEQAAGGKSGPTRQPQQRRRSAA